MEPSVIDTLRYADRLKAAGVETRQAEAMSRALNDELAGSVATKQDLDRAVEELRGEIAKVDAKVDALDAKFGALSERFETQGRYVFLVLALITALGLYNAVAPHLATTAPQTDAESAEPARA
ncbi:MAG: hypothetical protein OXT64_01630 [Gammaproteobacteria bacterium]|nr:hypothetical protein [Gammaproteobacteria bacterium]